MRGDLESPPLRRAAGHFWTLFDHVRGGGRVPQDVAWSWETSVDDPKVGPVRLTGLLEPGTGAHDRLVVLVHGLGGSAVSRYAERFAVRARAAGLPLLRLNLRGSDRLGEDFYHAALTADLAAALGSPEVWRYETILLLGYSMGGHLIVRYLADEPDPRVRAAACVSAPLDLAAGQALLDGQRFAPYRHYVLTALKEIYRAIARRREVPVPWPEVEKIDLFFDFDDRVVAPRHDFNGAADYYDRASAGPHLPQVGVPTLFLACREDPMVPSDSVAAHLAHASPAVQPVWAPGGHVAFPQLDLGLEAPHGLEGQVLAWLARRVDGGPDRG